MGKRAGSDEKPFRPLDTSILNGVLQHPTESPSDSTPILDEPSPAEQSFTPRVNFNTQSTTATRPIPQVHRLDQEKRILFTREESQALDRLVANLAVQLRCQLKTSHVIRALTGLLLKAEREIDRRASERGALTRPPNGDLQGLQVFEFAVAEILVQGIRDAGPLTRREERWDHDLRR